MKEQSAERGHDIYGYLTMQFHAFFQTLDNNRGSCSAFKDLLSSIVIRLMLPLTSTWLINFQSLNEQLLPGKLSNINSFFALS